MSKTNSSPTTPIPTPDGNPGRDGEVLAGNDPAKSTAQQRAMTSLPLTILALQGTDAYHEERIRRLEEMVVDLHAIASMLSTGNKLFDATLNRIEGKFPSFPAWIEQAEREHIFQEEQKKQREADRLEFIAEQERKKQDAKDQEILELERLLDRKRQQRDAENAASS